MAADVFGNSLAVMNVYQRERSEVRRHESNKDSQRALKHNSIHLPNMSPPTRTSAVQTLYGCLCARNRLAAVRVLYRQGQMHVRDEELIRA